jgi:hypothetical protein
LPVSSHRARVRPRRRRHSGRPGHASERHGLGRARARLQRVQARQNRRRALAELAPHDRFHTLGRQLEQSGGEPEGDDVRPASRDGLGQRLEGHRIGARPHVGESPRHLAFAGVAGNAARAVNGISSEKRCRLSPVDRDQVINRSSMFSWVRH